MDSNNFDKTIDQILAYGPSKKKGSDRIDQERLLASLNRLRQKRKLGFGKKKPGKEQSQ